MYTYQISHKFLSTKKNCDNELVTTNYAFREKFKKNTYRNHSFLQNTNTALEHPGFDQGFQFTIHIDTCDHQDFLISISFCS